MLSFIIGGALIVTVLVTISWTILWFGQEVPGPWALYNRPRRERRNCPTCNGYPSIWLDRCTSYHGYGITCPGHEHKNGRHLCTKHRHRWKHIRGMEKELLEEG